MKGNLLIFVLTGALLVGCDDIRDSAVKSEQADRTYRAAMDDYQAGRIPEALAGLRKSCSENPANASARFQLACLLQDSQKDYLGAFCAYREYLLQRPESDKAKLAKDRLAVCEREMARTLAEKYAPKTAQDALRAAQESRAALSKAEANRDKAARDLERLQSELEALRRENTRLKGLMRDEATEKADDSFAEDLVAAKAMKAEAEGAAKAKGDKEVAEAKRLLDAEAEVAAPDNREAAEAKRLLDSEEEAAAPVFEQKNTAKATSKKPAEGAAKPTKYLHEKRPDTYVVQDGDTLYKIALRFYGHASAWSLIRNANRATISTDGRVRRGQKLVLPPEAGN